MTKMVLYFSGNASHSYTIEGRWEKMVKEKMGLEAMGKSGLPIAVSNQGIDREILPFLEEIIPSYKNLTLVNAPYGHGFFPLIFRGQSRKLKKLKAQHLKWQIRKKIPGSVDLTFFPEFAAPESDFIPSKRFFYLSSQTCNYSLATGAYQLSEKDIRQIPEETIAVDYNGKIGIAIDSIDDYLKAWFKYTAVPSDENLEALLCEFDALAYSGRQACVIVMDLEQPWVGSLMGEVVLEKFFQALARRPSSENLVDLVDVFEECDKTKVKINQPHRISSKWSVHPGQFEAMMTWNLLYPQGEKQLKLFSLLSTSDYLSSLNRFFRSSMGKKGNTSFMVQTREGSMTELPQGHNPQLQAVCQAAFNAFRHPEKSLAKRIDEIRGVKKNYFMERIQAWAIANNL